MENNKEIEDGTVSTEATYVSTEATFTDEHSLHNPTTEQSLHLEQSATRIESQPCGPCMEAATNTNIMAKWFCQDCNEYFCTGCRADHDVLKMAQNHKVCEIVLKCDQCSRKELSSEANWHCTECDEHLCGDCKSVHRKFKATKNHKIMHSREHVWREEAKQPQDRGRDVEKKQLQICKFIKKYVLSCESVMSGTMVICFLLYGGTFCSSPAIPELAKTYSECSWRMFAVLNATVPGDKRTPYTSSVAFLPDGRLLLIDESNQKLKIFDQQCHFIKEKEFTDTPVTIAVYDNSEISVAFAKSIFRYSVQEDIVFKESVSLDFEVFCLDYVSRDQLAVADLMGMLYVINTDGEILSRIKEVNGKRLFHDLLYVTADTVRSRVYVASCDDNSVVALDLVSANIDVLFTYKHHGLICPEGMTTDNEGNLYVCAFESSNVQMINLHGEYVDTITEEGLIQFPEKISLTSDGETFVVITTTPNFKTQVIEFKNRNKLST